MALEKAIESAARILFEQGGQHQDIIVGDTSIKTYATFDRAACSRIISVDIKIEYEHNKYDPKNDVVISQPGEIMVRVERHDEKINYRLLEHQKSHHLASDDFSNNPIVIPY